MEFKHFVFCLMNQEIGLPDIAHLNPYHLFLVISFYEESYILKLKKIYMLIFF